MTAEHPITNAKRAERARQVLATYNDEYDLASNVVDFLTDLQHYCRIANGVDLGRHSFNDALQIARKHFAAETGGAVSMTRKLHTPGVWQRNGNQVIAVHADEDGEHETLICDVFDDHDWWRGNARLIVAAPRLLAGAELAENQLAEYCGADDGRDTEARLALQEVRDALAKAKGGRP